MLLYRNTRFANIFGGKNNSFIEIKRNLVFSTINEHMEEKSASFKVFML